MASKDETVEGIAKEMCDEWAQVYYSEGTRRKDGECCDNEFAAIEPKTVAARIEAAHKREIAKLREYLKEAVTDFCTHRPHEYDDGFGNCESFKNGSCVCEECWRSELVDKWRKALGGADSEGK